MAKDETPKVFTRQLFNRGRWYTARRVGSISIFPTALVEYRRNSHDLSTTFIWSSRPYLEGSFQVREILPEGFVLPPPINIRDVDVILAEGSRLNFSSHGGGCCGRSHLFGFGVLGPTRILISSLKNQTTPNRCFEICLTTSQANRRGLNDWTWKQVLTHLGWKMVMKFRNGNSGNTVLVFLYSSSERD